MKVYFQVTLSKYSTSSEASAVPGTPAAILKNLLQYLFLFFIVLIIFPAKVTDIAALVSPRNTNVHIP